MNRAPTEEQVIEYFQARTLGLVERFPYQFREPNFDFAIGPGWLDLLEKTCSEIDAALSPEGRDLFHWRQIKEKFGGIRLYYSGAPARIDIRMSAKLISVHEREDPEDFIAKIIAQAEAASHKICEICGASGTREMRHGWIRTACEMHTKRPEASLDDTIH